MSQTPKFQRGKVDVTPVEIKGSRLPSYVKCCVCGKPPIGTDWLKPVNPDPNCRKFIHLSHIHDGPGISKEGDWYLRNA